MANSAEVRLAELLCSRLCHDLVSPVGAVNNGVELIRELDPSSADEAMDLIAESGELAARRLRVFRMAFGRAGTEAISTNSVARDLCADFLRGSRVELDWATPSGDDPAVRAEGFGKLVLNLAIIVADSLPRGGRLSVRTAIMGDRLRASIQAAGEGATLNSDLLAALNGTVTVEGLTPQSVGAYFANGLMDRIGGQLNVDAGAADSVNLELVAPVPEPATTEPAV